MTHKKFYSSQILVFLILSACATKSENKFDHLIQTGKCEEASLNVPTLTPQKITAELKMYTGTMTSYLLTGSAYGVDAIFFTTGGLILPVAICAPLSTLKNPFYIPLALIGVPMHNFDQAQDAEKCMEDVHNSTQSYDKNGDRKNLGAKVYKKTIPLRCSDIEFLSQYLLSISDCFEKNGKKESAHSQLQSILAFKKSNGCLDEKSKDELVKKMESLSP